MRSTLHIGLEKTGTTTIQANLAGQRDALRRHGVLYPVDPHTPGHLKQKTLPWLVCDRDMYDNGRIFQGIQTPERFDRFYPEIEARITSWMETPGVEHILLSNEWLLSRLSMVAEISRLKSFLNRWTDDVTVIMCAISAHCGCPITISKSRAVGLIRYGSFYQNRAKRCAKRGRGGVCHASTHVRSTPFPLIRVRSGSTFIM